MAVAIPAPWNPTWKGRSVGSQAAPTQDTWYPLFTATRRTRLILVGIGVDTADETLECKWVINGTTYTGNSQAATAGSQYYVRVSASFSGGTPPDGDLTVTGTQQTPGVYGALDVDNIIIYVRKTTALGAGKIYCNVQYAQ